MSDKPLHQTTPDDVDEFLHGIWWVSDGVGGLRDASLSECAAEIKKLRRLLWEIQDQSYHPSGYLKDAIEAAVKYE